MRKFFLLRNVEGVKLSKFLKLCQWGVGEEPLCRFVFTSTIDKKNPKTLQLFSLEMLIYFR